MTTLDLINQQRAAHGLSPLRNNPQLAAAAREHALDMAGHPGMVHVGSDGSEGGERTRRAGYDWRKWGEVTGWGWQGSAAKMVEWWMNSPDHRPYLLDPEMEDIGVGYVYAPGSQWDSYWTVNFGKPAGVAPQPGPDAPPPVVDAPRPTGAIDLHPYLCGDGRTYRVGNAWGSYEVFQSQDEGGRFYQVKAWDSLEVVNWEEFVLSAETIGRDVDTSPGAGRFYRQFGAAWVKRVMRVGESFTQVKRVQFYRQSDCSPLSMHSGTVTDTIRLVAHHEHYTFRTLYSLPDVIELQWVQGGERYFYSRSYGLVGWERLHQDPNSPAWSAISEMKPGVGRLERLRIDCLE